MQILASSSGISKNSNVLIFLCPFLHIVDGDNSTTEFDLGTSTFGSCICISDNTMTNCATETE